MVVAAMGAGANKREQEGELNEESVAAHMTKFFRLKVNIKGY
jgi:hypothetical protein